MNQSGDALLDACRAHVPCPLCNAAWPAVQSCTLCGGVGVKAEVLAAFRVACSPRTVAVSEGGFSGPAHVICTLCGVTVPDGGVHSYADCAGHLKDACDTYVEQWLEAEAECGDLAAAQLRHRLRALWRKIRTFLQ